MAHTAGSGLARCRTADPKQPVYPIGGAATVLWALAFPKVQMETAQHYSIPNQGSVGLTEADPTKEPRSQAQRGKCLAQGSAWHSPCS